MTTSQTSTKFQNHYALNALNLFNSRRDLKEKVIPQNYGEWLHLAFKVFAENFPYAYTRKYWTVDPVELTTDWVCSSSILR